MTLYTKPNNLLTSNI